MNKVKAVRLPHEMAYPRRFVLDRDACSEKTLESIKAACKYNAVELDMQPRTFTLQVAAIVWATGWNPYDPAKLTQLSFNTSPAIITNMMMERLVAPNGQFYRKNSE